MPRQKEPVHRVQMTEGKRNIFHQLLEEYDIQSAEDIRAPVEIGSYRGFKMEVFYDTVNAHSVKIFAERQSIRWI